jgi:hypothetical protein
VEVVVGVAKFLRLSVAQDPKEVTEDVRLLAVVAVAVVVEEEVQMARMHPLKTSVEMGEMEPSSLARIIAEVVVGPPRVVAHYPPAVSVVVGWVDHHTVSVAHRGRSTQAAGVGQAGVTQARMDREVRAW